MPTFRLQNRELGSGPRSHQRACEGVVSSEGNALLGRIENAFKRLSRVAKATTLPIILRNMASYLEREDTGTLHPQGFRQLWKRFNSFNKEIQLDILKKLGVNRQQLGMYQF